MAPRANQTARAVLFAALAAALVLEYAGGAAAQPPPRPGSATEFLSTSIFGDVEANRTSSPGWLHIFGGTGASAAGYVPGPFDNGREGIGDRSFPVELGLVLDLERGGQGLTRGPNLTLGTSNSLFSDPRFAGDEDESPWHESNQLVGLAARLDAGGGLLGAAKPQFKVALPVRGGDGWYAEIRAEPEYEAFRAGDAPITVSVPLTLGMGFNDYYGSDADSGGFVSVGLAGSMPLTQASSDYRSWTLRAGVDMLLRNDDLRGSEPGFADDRTVVIGGIRLRFAY